MADEVKFDLKRGLNAWVDGNTTIKDFAVCMGYAYANAWSVLRGKVPVTVETVGRFALAYGPAELGNMLELAGLAEDQKVMFKRGIPVAVRVTDEVVYASNEEVA